MPKKLNFLGGQQNYDPKTGEYEPALKGPNGESPSGFKSFKKSESSFDATNKKRMGKSKGLGYDPRNREESTRNHNKNIEKINDQYGRNKLTKQEWWDAIDLEDDRWKNEQNYWYEKEDPLYMYDKDVAEQQAQRRKEIGDVGVLEKQREDYKPKDFDKNDEDSIWDAYEKGDITEKERNKLLSERSGEVAKSGFDQINNKRMGKEQAKSHKSADRKDKYGNPLVSDDAFRVGQKAAKEYLDQLNEYEGFESAKGSFVTLDGFRDAISDALEQNGLNPNYDLTYQDLNEIIGSVTGEEVDFEDYEGNGKGWTGKKYSGYNPSAEQTKEIEPKQLASKIKSVADVKNVFGKYLSDKEMSKIDKSKNLYVEISKQYKGEDNYKIIDDEYIKGAFSNGSGTVKDLERYMKDNKDYAYFVKIK